MSDAADLQPPLARIAQTLARLRARAQAPNEADTKAALIEPVLEALGWDVKDPDAVSREWRGTGPRKDNPADYALFSHYGETPVLLIEAKPLGADLDADDGAKQAITYANNQGVEWCVLTDGWRWDVYRARAPGKGIERRFLRADLAAGDVPSFRLLAKDALVPQPPLLEQAWETRELRAKVEKALLEDAADRAALVRRLRKRLPGLDPKQIQRVLYDLLHQASERPAAGQAPVLRQAGPDAGAPRGGAPTAGRRGARRKRAAEPAAGVRPDEGVACRLPLPDGGEALGRLSADLKRLTLAAGSLIPRDPAGAPPPFVVKARERMRQADALEAAGPGRWRLLRDWPAGSPSTAASIVRGPSLNGWGLWRLDDGRPIDALRKDRQG